VPVFIPVKNNLTIINYDNSPYFFMRSLFVFKFSDNTTTSTNISVLKIPFFLYKFCKSNYSGIRRKGVCQSLFLIKPSSIKNLRKTMPINMSIEFNPTTILSPLITIYVAYGFCGSIVYIRTFVTTISTFAKIFFAKI